MTVKQPFPRATPESQGIPSMAIESFVNNAERGGYELHSIMVLRHGKVCAEGWWKPYGPDKVHNVHSYTKSFLSTALGIVVAQGKLSVEDDVLSFFPEDAPKNPCGNLKKMKIRHLLTMNTGHHDEPAIRGEKDFIKAFFAWPVDHEPGTWFRYNSNASHMISRIIHKATGKTFTEVLDEHIFGPMGFGPYECSTMADGFPAGGGGLALTLEDMARLAQLYLNKGEWGGRQIVPAEWIEASVTPQSDNSNGLHVEGNEDWEAGYGYQLWLNEPLNTYRFDGALGQVAVICPEQDMAVVFNAATQNLAGLLRLVWRLVLTSLSDGPLPENPGGRKQLYDRLAALKLPELAPDGKSLMQGGVDGRRITFRKNELLPVTTFRLGGAVSAPAGGVRWIEPSFGGKTVKLAIETDAGRYDIEAGMEGEPVVNTLSVEGEGLEFLASAKWIDQNLLQIAWRQLRVVQATFMTIAYRLDGVELSVRHAPRGGEETINGYYA